MFHQDICKEPNAISNGVLCALILRCLKLQKMRINRVSLSGLYENGIEMCKTISAR